jgi:aminopeptidase-like protein
MGQNGGYAVWQTIGSPFQSFAADSALNTTLKEIIGEHTDADFTYLAGPAGTDSLPFAAANIPSTSLATQDSALGFSGLHTPADNLSRVTPEKVAEGVLIMEKLIAQIDAVPTPSP